MTDLGLFCKVMPWGDYKNVPQGIPILALLRVCV